MPKDIKYEKQSSSVVHEIITEDHVNAIDVKELRRNRDIWAAKIQELQAKVDRADIIIAESEK